jgi:hypothetical protein
MSTVWPSPDGSLIASSYDGQLRRYGPDLRLTAKPGGLAGQRPFGVAIDPAGRRLAVGFAEAAKVSILDAVTLAPIADAEVGGVTNGDLFSVAWSRDGGTLAAGGRAAARWQGEWRFFVREFDPNGRRRGPDIPVSANTVIDLRPCGESFAFAAQDPAFGLANAGGPARTLQGPRTADMRAKVRTALEISGDGASVRFGLGYGEEKPVLFDLAAGSLADSPDAPAGLAPARIEGLPVTDWENSVEPKFKGVKIGLENYEPSRSLAVRPDRSGFALGAEWDVRAFDATGKPTWKQPGPGVAFGVDYSPDGRILVVAYGDGTIRWLRGSDGAELLALFVDVPTRKWVAWTPTGYYMASAGGEDLIGWHLNRGWSQLADFFSAAQFRGKYNRPDVVKRVLKTLDEGEALRRANEAAQREASAAVKPAVFPPVVTFRSPTEGAEIKDKNVVVSYDVRSPSGLNIDKLDVLVDGQAVAYEPANPAGTVTFARPELPKAKITLIAHSGELPSAPVNVDLVFPRPPPDLRPKLYALLVGVTGYKDKELDNIKFAGRDAEGFAEALKRQNGGLYADVQVRILDAAAASSANPNRAGPPTREQVFEGFKWLNENARKGDLSLVYLSGHGFNDTVGSKFWFLTQESDFDLLETTAVSGDEVLARLRKLHGKKLLFIDACYAGAALASPGAKASPMDARPNMDDLVNKFTVADTGIVAYAAAQAQEKAWEKDDLKHGAFGEALIEAFGEGRGALDGALTTDLLDRYLTDRVMDLTKKAQHPVANRPQPVPDFPVALVR